MTLKKCLLIFLLVPLLGATNTVTSASPGGVDNVSLRAGEDIQRLFFRFKDAARRHQGEDFVALVTPETIQRFASIKALTLNADEATLSNADLTNQFFVLLFRLELSPEEIAVMSPRDFIIFAVDDKALGTNISDHSEMVNLQIEGDSASAVHKKLNKMVKPGWKFAKNSASGEWRVELNPLLDHISGDVVRVAGLGSEDSPSRDLQLETLHTIVEVFTFKSLTRKHFQPYNIGEFN